MRARPREGRPVGVIQAERVVESGSGAGEEAGLGIGRERLRSRGGEIWRREQAVRVRSVVFERVRVLVRR